MFGQEYPVRILAGKLRRFFTVHFRKDYLDRQLRARQGECLQCGICCHFSLACPLLTRDTLCRVYHTCRPKACRVFPIDRKDIDDVAACGGNCGYRFDPPPANPSTQ